MVRPTVSTTVAQKAEMKDAQKVANLVFQMAANLVFYSVDRWAAVRVACWVWSMVY